METVTASNEPQPAKNGRRQRSGTAFPVYALADSVRVAQLIHERGGGIANDDQLASYLNYKSPRNGAYLGRVGAAKLFGLIAGGATQFTITPLAQKILMPVYAAQAQEGLVEAFLKVPLFRGVFDECRGKELPPEFGMKNLLRQKFQIIPARVGNAYRVLMDSADTAGFFATRGSRSHLIMPAVVPTVTPPVDDAVQRREPDDVKRGGGGGGGDDGGHNGRTPPPAVKTREELQNEYVSTLIELLRNKSALGGEIDADLMARIEKLLALNPS